MTGNMDTSIYNAPWKVRLYELIQEAERTGQWLRCSYQNMWFSPAALMKIHADGRLMWGVDNWELRDPRDHLAAADRDVKEAQAKYDRIAAEISQSSAGRA